MFRQLTILMWKHMVVRRRKPLHTVIDFLIPLVFFILLFSIKSKLKPEKLHDRPMKGEVGPTPTTVVYGDGFFHSVKIGLFHFVHVGDILRQKQIADPYQQIWNIYKNQGPLFDLQDIIELTDIMPPPHWIVYYPDTILTNLLMDEVGTKLGLKRLDSFPGHSKRGYYPLRNSSRLSDIAADMQIMEVILIFHSMMGESWPDHLNYTIRMKGDFGTESYHSRSQEMVPHRMYGLKYGTFMRVQWAIDTSYIKLLTGNNIPQSVSLQEFPLDGATSTDRAEAAKLIFQFLQPIYVFSLSLTFTFLMSRLLQDRSTGVQELLLMAGVSLNKQRLSHILNVLPIGVVYSIVVTVLLKLPPNALVEYSASYTILIFNFLYFNFIVSFAFAFHFILTDSQYASSVSVLIYILTWLPANYLYEKDTISPFIVYVAGILPHMPMYWFTKELALLESYRKGSHITNMGKTHASNSASVLTSYIYLIIQTAICYAVTWYLSYVRPGKYGQALPWNFIFQAQYWTGKNNLVIPTTAYDETTITVNPKYFEPAPLNSVVGIKIVNVSKIYPKHRALKNINLDVFKGEITVLLGHNGAGKTTLMSIITGMTGATTGKVYANGKDTLLQQNEIRKQMGLCAQHDIFFGDLTVEEHLMLFTLLRGDNISFAEARKSARELAAKLGLEPKLNSLTSHLSGGMKRRTQLGMALAGGANILVLDEPTSGLDVETRRELWDLLLSLRGDRTVLISTHYMEEADALGDRVAAIQDGVLKCSATPMYLKNAVGTGYRLSFITVGVPQEEAITNAMTSIIPGANLKEKTINSLTYYLPTTDTSNFPDMFAALEAKRAELGIASIGLGVATLEEVFITLCSNIDTSLTEEEVDATLFQPAAVAQKVTGIPLYMQQFYILWMRQIKYTMYRKWLFLITQIILPIFIFSNFTLSSNNLDEDKNMNQTTLNMDLDIYGDRASSRVLYNVDGPDITPQDVFNVQKRFPKVDFEDTKDVASALLRTSREDMFKYNDYLVGLEINDTDAKVLYTTTIRHAAPVGLNLLSNMLASHYISWSDGKTITTLNEPITRTPSQQPLDTKKKDIISPKSTVKATIWIYFIQFFTLVISGGSISLPCRERLTGTRHIHLMSGCPPLLHWMVAILYHAAICILTIIIPVVVIVLLLEADNTIDQSGFLGTFVLLMLFGSVTYVAFSYIVSFGFRERSTNVIHFSIVFIFGIITSLYCVGNKTLAPGEKNLTYYFSWLCKILAVPHNLMIASYGCMKDAIVNANCKAFKQFCPLVQIGDADDTKKCCSGQTPRKYLDLKEDGAGQGLLILIAQCVVFMTIVILLEKGFFNGLWNKIRNSGYQPVPGPEPSNAVRAEEEYIKKTIKLPANQIPDSALIHNLHKVYTPCFRKKVYACEGINFSVKKGECFGLLGVNGAGKSTVFKIITAEESATRGKMFINGYHHTGGMSQYLKTLGYCPQFFGLDLFLTGEANLKVILTLRGYPRKYMDQEIKNWIQIVGLEQYARQITNGYSGGCLRRMGAAAALCGDAELTLLDEPSAGVDVVARRRLWTAMRKALKRGRSIVITSHSMDEMEALCNRIAIMANGHVRALGSASGLRAEHAKGFAVMFKLKNFNRLDAESIETLAKFKGRLHEVFNCTLKDEHVTMLHYHINEVIPLSQLFNTLEGIRREFPSIIEDYAVSETTLEEVFLSYATEKRTVRQPHNAT